MSGRITLYGASEILLSFFTKGTQAPPNFYVALIKDIAPTPYLSGAELDEPVMESYARAALPADLASWTLVGMNTISTAVDAVFPTATEGWGTCRFWALCSAEVEGYVYAIGDMDPLTVEDGDVVTLFEGDLSFSLGPFFNTEEL